MVRLGYGFWGGGEHRGDVLFSSHYIRGTRYDHDSSADLGLLAQVVFVRFLHRQVTLPHLSMLCSLERSHYAKLTIEGGVFKKLLGIFLYGSSV